MFSNQPSYEQGSTGKRISGFEVRKGEFSLAWDHGSNTLNDYQKRKSKMNEITHKPNHIQPSKTEIQQPISQQLPYQNKSNQYQQEEVIGYLKKYQHIDQMPADELQKVMAYYDSLKQPKKTPPIQESYNKNSRQLQTPSQQYIERREPIRPKQTMGGIIYGNQATDPMKPVSRYSQKKNQTNIMIGDGYNYFKEEAIKKQQEDYARQQIQQPVYSNKNDYKRMGNIHLG